MSEDRELIIKEGERIIAKLEARIEECKKSITDMQGVVEEIRKTNERLREKQEAR